MYFSNQILDHHITIKKKKKDDIVGIKTFSFLAKNVFFWNKAILKNKLTPAQKRHRYKRTQRGKEKRL